MGMMVWIGLICTWEWLYREANSVHGNDGMERPILFMGITAWIWLGSSSWRPILRNKKNVEFYVFSSSFKYTHLYVLKCLTRNWIHESFFCCFGVSVSLPAQFIPSSMWSFLCANRKRTNLCTGKIFFIIIYFFFYSIKLIFLHLNLFKM